MSRVRRGLICVLCLALSGCAGLAAGAEEQAASPSPQPASQEPVATPAPTPTPEPTPAPVSVDDLVGEDGRLTVLILGSDYRKGILGERTDAIVIGTVDPADGRVTMVSLPRDSVNVPIGPDEVYAGRINTLLTELERSKGRKKALDKLRDALAYAFDIEIDYYALVDFRGLVRLVNSIGGVELTLEEAFVDPSMHIGKKGLRLKAGTRRIDGKTALAYSRSRHTDSDYDRSRRQHEVLAAVAEKVRARGLEALPALVDLASRKIVTDLPLEAAPALLELAADARLGSPKSVVLAPGRFARSGPQAYTIVPKIIEVQKMFGRAFGARP